MSTFATFAPQFYSLMAKRGGFDKFQQRKSNAAKKEEFRQEKKKWRKERDEFFEKKKRGSFGGSGQSRAIGNRQSTMGNRQSSSEQSAFRGGPKRAMGNRQRATGNEQSSFRGGPKRAMGNRQSSSARATADRSAIGNEQQSSYRGGPKRAMGNRQSTIGNEQQSSYRSGPKRATSNRQSTIGNEQQSSYRGGPKRTMGNRQRATGNEQSSFQGGPKRAMGNRQRATGNEQTSFRGGPKKAMGNRQRATGDEQKSFRSDSRSKEFGKRQSSFRSDSKNRTIGNRQPAYGKSSHSSSQRDEKKIVHRRVSKPVPDKSLQLMPLNKYISNSGVCSRRDAAELVRQGAVLVNGKKIIEPGHKVSEQDEVQVNGKKIQLAKNLVYILLNKPKDYITTADDPEQRKTVLDLIKTKDRIFPVGRLDRNTSGVLLLTNDGELSQTLTHPSHEVKKIYHIVLNKPLDKKDFDTILQGVKLDDGMATVDVLAYADIKDKTQIGLEIHSGRNRIVRRIFEKLGYDVRQLDRVMFAGLTKKNVDRGKWRFLNEKEIRNLKFFGKGK